MVLRAAIRVVVIAVGTCSWASRTHDGDVTVRPWRRATALTVGVLLTMTACGSGSNDTARLEPRLQRMVPSQAPAVSVTPRDGQPAGTRQVKGTYFTLYVPASFQEKSVPQANGEQMVMFDAPSSNPATPVRVAVVPDPASTQSALESSYLVEGLKQSQGVKDLTRSTVKWPGAQNAILLQWTSTAAGAGTHDEPLRTWQLMAQVDGRLVVTIVAVAPAGEFDAAGLAKIVETFRANA